MNRVFQSSTESILFRLSDAAEHYQGDNGRFKVIYQQSRTKTFSSLLEAFLFYITLDEEADLLDVSKDSIIIESKIKLYLN